MNLWPAELFAEIDKINNEIIDTEMERSKVFKDVFKSRYLANPPSFVNVSTSNGPAEWIQKELRDRLVDGIKDGFEKPAAPALSDAIDSLNYAVKFSNNGKIKINIDDEKENNMAMVNFGGNNDYNRIKDVLNVTSMSIKESPYSAPEVEIRGYIPYQKINDKKEYNTMYKKNEVKVPQCKGIIRRDKTTRVDWADGTRTVIVLEEGREDMDMFHTFCIAFTKKMLGSTTAILNTIKECDTDAVEKARKEAIEKANREAEEETKKLKAEMEAAAFEKAVQEKMFEERVIEEAIRRISIQEERRMNREAGEDDSEDCHGISIERFAEVLRNVMNREKKTEDIADETRE